MRRGPDAVRAAPVRRRAGQQGHLARRMREEDIGAVLVTEGDRLRGLVGDRDLVVRVPADGGDPEQQTVASVCSGDLVTVTPDGTSTARSS